MKRRCLPALSQLHSGLLSNGTPVAVLRQFRLRSYDSRVRKEGALVIPRRLTLLTGGILALGFGSGVWAAPVMSLRPAGATCPHALNGDEITVFQVPCRVTMEVRIADWDTDGNGTPKVRTYQATIDAASYTTGSAGSLSPALLPCGNDNDCFATSNCEASGFCDAYGSIYGDLNHSDYIFAGFNSFVVADVTSVLPDYRIGGLILTAGVGAADPGTDRYAATMLLDISADAEGTFTVSLGSDQVESFITDVNFMDITPLSLLPAKILVVKDCNQNGTPDAQDISGGTSEDCNGNGLPDECEPDCNNNGIADACDISGGSDDCNTNGVPDECEPDCNANDIADDCEIVGPEDDCNENTVPDLCEAGFDQDCNNNGEPDLCDLFNALDTDCNENAVPDDCDIGFGTSADCNANNTPDDCEPDCNRNGVADACDISSGYSLDNNLDGRPDECIRGFSLVPVGATTAHDIFFHNEILIPMGGARVTLEARLSGWDPDLNGSPKVGFYEAVVDNAGFNGVLSLAAVECSTGGDCYLNSGCSPSGVCGPTSSAYVNTGHANFVFFGLQPFAHTTFSGGDIDFGGFLTGQGNGRADPGHDVYLGTLMVDVPPDATGSYTIEFSTAAALNEFDVQITGLTEEIPAVIHIIEDCNSNGVRDDLDIANQMSADDNANGVPDECEADVPVIIPTGSRYLEIFPRDGDVPVALKVTSPQFPCFAKYVESIGGGKGRLTDAPTYQTPEEWGSITLLDAHVIPGATYRIQVEYAGGFLSQAASASTTDWGDSAPPWGMVDFLDISGTVDRFKSLPTAPPVGLTDFHPATPDGVIDFLDISANVDAFRGYVYPFGSPCP